MKPRIFHLIRILPFLILGILSIESGLGQELQFRSDIYQEDYFSQQIAASYTQQNPLVTDKFSGTALSINAPIDILPEFAKENPTGYSYLCRLELSLEQKMPVSMWIKLGDQQYGTVKGNVHAQLKLKRF